MYHIFAAERHRQDGAGQGKYQAARKAALDATADPPCLVELGVAILASIGRVDQQVHLARAGRLLDPFGAVDQVAAPRLEPKPIERRLAKRGLDPLAEISRDLKLAGLERAGERALQFALGLRLLKRGAADADPRPTAIGAGTDIGRDLA